MKTKKILMMVFLFGLMSCSDHSEKCKEIGSKADATSDEFEFYAKKCLNPKDGSKNYE